MNLASFRAVIFDCDGVLVDSELLGLRSLQQALHEADLDLPLSSLTRFSGRGHNETLAMLEAESGLPLLMRGVGGRMDECYMDIVAAEGLRSCAGIPELLSWLSVQHIPYAVASSGPRRKVLSSLRACGLASVFPYLVCGDDVTRAKPAPDLYLSAAALIGIVPSECLAIEDAPNGILSARAAGMQVIAVTTSFVPDALKEADLIVDSSLLLPQLLTDLLALQFEI